MSDPLIFLLQEQYQEQCLNLESELLCCPVKSYCCLLIQQSTSGYHSGLWESGVILLTSLGEGRIKSEEVY